MVMTCPDVCRFTIHGHWSTGRAIDNVLDYQVDTTGGTLTREEGIEGYADDIIQNWQAHVLPFLTDNYTVDGISWVDLDQEDGSTGNRPPSVGDPTNSGTAQASCPPQVCFLVKKSAIGGRGKRSGRLYISGVAEVDCNEDGTLRMDPGQSPALLEAGLEVFRENTEQPGPVDREGIMVVVHLGPRPAPGQPDNRVGTYTPVTSLLLDPMVATQRRRLR